MSKTLSKFKKNDNEEIDRNGIKELLKEREQKQKQYQARQLQRIRTCDPSTLSRYIEGYLEADQ